MNPEQLVDLLDELEDEDDDVDVIVKEMFDARLPRVDAVMGPAHNRRFVVMKALDLRAQPRRDVVIKSAAITDPPKRFVLGVAYPAESVDGHGDWMSADELEKAAWDFLKNGRQLGFYHVDGDSTLGHADVVESSIWRGPTWETTDINGEPQVIKQGDWVLGAVLDEPAFDLVRRGKAEGWSVDGAARRRHARPPARPVAKMRNPSTGADRVTEILRAAEGRHAIHLSSESDGRMFRNGQLIGYAKRLPSGGISFDFGNPSQVPPP